MLARIVPSVAAIARVSCTNDDDDQNSVIAFGHVNRQRKKWTYDRSREEGVDTTRLRRLSPRDFLELLAEVCAYCEGVILVLPIPTCSKRRRTLRRCWHVICAVAVSGDIPSHRNTACEFPLKDIALVEEEDKFHLRNIARKSPRHTR